MTHEKRNPGAIDYFHKRITDFDDIYRDDKSGLIPFLNKYLRVSVRIRFNLAFEILGDLSGKSVLDIGCGSGRYMFKAIENHAEEVIGIDAADGALVKGRELGGQLGISDRIKFIRADFMDFEPQSKFDVIFAVGYFDYIFNPETHLKKMLEISKGTIYATFPKRWSVFALIRKIRLYLNGCPVRYYSGRDVEKLIENMECSSYEIKHIFRDNILIIQKN